MGKELQHFQEMQISDDESKMSVSSFAESIESGQISFCSSYHWLCGVGVGVGVKYLFCYCKTVLQANEQIRFYELRSLSTTLCILNTNDFTPWKSAGNKWCASTLKKDLNGSCSSSYAWRICSVVRRAYYFNRTLCILIVMWWFVVTMFCFYDVIFVYWFWPNIWFILCVVYVMTHSPCILKTWYDI